MISIKGQIGMMTTKYVNSIEIKSTIEICEATKKTETDKFATKLTSIKFPPKDWWKVLKSFIKPNQSSSVPPFNKAGVTFKDNIDKANLLNDYFAD